MMGSDVKLYLKAFLLKTLVVGVFVMATQMKLGPDPTDKLTVASSPASQMKS